MSSQTPSYGKNKERRKNGGVENGGVGWSILHGIWGEGWGRWIFYLENLCERQVEHQSSRYNSLERAVRLSKKRTYVCLRNVLGAMPIKEKRKS